MTEPLCIRYNNLRTTAPCLSCGDPYRPPIGFIVFNNRMSPVCDRCASEADAHLWAA
jgi:hypothetical protein